MAFAATVFAGFARTYYLRPQFQTTSLPLYLHVHGFVFTAWIALFLTQTTLVAARRTDVHRRLGWIAAGWAPLMAVAAMTAAILSGQRAVAAGHADEARTFLAVPMSSVLVFLTLIGFALWRRRHPETHKRLMMLATIGILDAAVARWPLELVAATPWAYFVVTDAFIAIGIAYDLLLRRRIHPAYVWGGLLTLCGQLSRDIVGPTAVWHAFARLLIG